MTDVDLEPLSELSVLTAAGTPVRVATAWAERPTVLVWLRHFG